MGRFLAILVILLAGCTSPAQNGGTSECRFDDLALCDLEEHYAQHDCVKNDVPRVYAPDSPSPDAPADPWQRGDWWEYTLVVDGEDYGTTKLVYYADQDIVQGVAQHYMVGAPTSDEALQHALFSNNPALGRIHRTLYSPHESGVHADMFHFPLCEGSTWSSKFFGRDFEFAASRSPVSTGTGSDDGFLIIGRATDGSAIEVTYSPAAKWFTSIDLDRADGFTVEMDMTATGSGYRGEAFFLRGQKDEVFDLEIQQSTDFEREAGGEGDYDLLGIHIDVAREGNDKVEVHIVDPSGQSVACAGQPGDGPLGGTECPPALTASVPWQAGTWRMRIDAPVVGETQLSGEVRIVSIYDRSGSV